MDSSSAVATSKKRWSTGDEKISGEENDDVEEEYDVVAWEALSKSFKEAQSVLDQNRALIQQVNENHQSMIHDNLVKNVALIREMNGNISKVSSLYSNLFVNFANIVHQRRASSSKNNSNDDKVEHVD